MNFPGSHQLIRERPGQEHNFKWPGVQLFLALTLMGLTSEIRASVSDCKLFSRHFSKSQHMWYLRTGSPGDSLPLEDMSLIITHSSGGRNLQD